MAYERSESSRDNFGEFIHQFQPETKTLIRKLERILIKLYRQNVSLLSNIYIYIFIWLLSFPILWNIIITIFVFLLLLFIVFVLFCFSKCWCMSSIKKYFPLAQNQVMVIRLLSISERIICLDKFVTFSLNVFAIKCVNKCEDTMTTMLVYGRWDTLYIYIYISLVWFVGFYGISTFVGYLTPNPFLCN